MQGILSVAILTSLLDFVWVKPYSQFSYRYTIMLVIMKFVFLCINSFPNVQLARELPSFWQVTLLQSFPVLDRLMNSQTSKADFHGSLLLDITPNIGFCANKGMGLFSSIVLTSEKYGIESMLNLVKCISPIFSKNSIQFSTSHIKVCFSKISHRQTQTNSVQRIINTPTRP